MDSGVDGGGGGGSSSYQNFKLMTKSLKKKVLLIKSFFISNLRNQAVCIIMIFFPKEIVFLKKILN